MTTPNYTHIGTPHDIKFRAVQFAIVALRDECLARQTAERYESVPAESLTYEIYAGVVAQIYGMPAVTIHHCISRASVTVGNMAAVTSDGQIASIAHRTMELLNEEAHRVPLDSKS